MRSALIFGAGRIGRGFLGQLLHRAGYRLFLVDAQPEVVALLRARGGYHVHVAGNPAQDERIPVADVALLTEVDWHPWLRATDLVASCVGAANLTALCAAVRPPLATRARVLDWLICENADRPAARMRALLGGEGRLGLVETQVLRSGMAATPAQQAADPLAVRVHDWWTLPCDAEAFVGPVPDIPGLQPRSAFAHELERKLYTFNGLNGPLAYLGAAAGHRFLHQAANDPALRASLDGVQAESAHGLLAEYGFDPEEHRAFQLLARRKYASPALEDPIARNARDVARKLGPRERLLGPALLCLAHGRFPAAFVEAIAAALRYASVDQDPDDHGTAAVRSVLQADGPAAVLGRFGGLAADHPLSRAVTAAASHEGVGP